jgi:hypothetical protein
MPLVMVPACAKAADGRANTKKMVAIARLHVMREIPLYRAVVSSMPCRCGYGKAAGFGRNAAFSAEHPPPAQKMQ